MNYSLAQKKAHEIVSQMTVEEQISQLVYESAPIERLGIKEYNWWNEALHGVARTGNATVFPQSIGIAAAFDAPLLGRVAQAISIEGRAKYNENMKYDDRGIYKGLTFWSPNINIFRDGRWGRGQETFGEDPFLTATLGVEFIKNLQTFDENGFIIATACAKHFAVHSGPEATRHEFDAKVGKKDLFETYLPAFEWAVKRAGVLGVMGAYNRTNGEPCCASKTLMEEILYDDWGFNGYYVSDCGAISDIHKYHHYTESHVESAALALKKGCHLNCGKIYKFLTEAYEEDLVTAEQIQYATEKLYTIRCILGEFEEERPFSDVGYEVIECDEHKELNLEISKKTLVLLENKDNFLPLKPKDYKTVAVVGPNSMSRRALEGNYCGTASEYINPADGVRKVFADSRVYVAEGGSIFGKLELIKTGVSAAANSDLTVLCLGYDVTVEGEEISGLNANQWFDGGDRRTMFLPDNQVALAEQVVDVSDNVIVVVMAGSPVDLGEKVRQKAKAIIHAWYPGAVGGLSIAKLITGDYSPSGRLPMTFPYADSNMPSIEEYSMKNRTYRYLEDKPLYPFGYGLSYTSFKYDNFTVKEEENGYKATVTVTNNGKFDSDVPVQIYAKYEDSRTTTPNFQLCAISNIKLEAGQSRELTFDIEKYWVSAVTEDGERVTPNGSICFFAGDVQPDERTKELSNSECVSYKLK